MMKKILALLLMGATIALTAKLQRRAQENQMPLMQENNQKEKDDKLIKASETGDTALASSMITAGANIEAVNGEGNTALHNAALYGYGAIAGILIDAGANLNPRDEEGATPLHKAADHNKTDVLRRLIQAGADLNAVDNDGDTALHYSVFHGYTDAVDLLKAGADANIKNKDRLTPLDIAVKKGDPLLATFLLPYTDSATKEALAKELDAMGIQL